MVRNSYIRELILWFYVVFLVIQAFFQVPFITYAMCSTAPTIMTPLVLDAMIWDTVTYEFEFSNSWATGYGPYIDLRLPSWVDSDDWITLNTATYLWTPLVIEVLTADGDFVDHPYAETVTWSQQIFINTWEQYIVIQIPFGSFANGQIADISLSLDIDSYADLWSPLNLTTQWWFQYWCDASNNPSNDPSQQWVPLTTSISPTIFTVEKIFQWSEYEMVSWPNFTSSYRITADIADWQTVTSMQLIDQLPQWLQYIWVSGISPAWSIGAEPSTTTPVTNWDNEVIVDFWSVTGWPWTVDVSMIVEYYVPEYDALGDDIIDPNTWDDELATNVWIWSWNWKPIDLDDTQWVVFDSDTTSNSIQSIAVQKTAIISWWVSVPWAIVEYTLDFQISDYFTFDDIVITDVLSDGLRHDSVQVPMFTVSDSFGSYVWSFTLNDTYIYDTSDVWNDTNTITSGTVSLVFNISEAITEWIHDGVLQWWYSTTWTSLPALWKITYTAVIQEEYTDTYPSWDSSVDVGDVLNNIVTIQWNVLDNDTLTFVGTESDTSDAGVRIDELFFSKSIYAVNGSTVLPDPFEMFPWDDVTYRLNYTMPSSDLESLDIVDFLPLPVFNVSQIISFDASMSPAVPLAWVVTYWPLDTLHTLTAPSVAWVPSILINVWSNTVAFDYGSFDDPLSRPSTIDLLFTVTVSDEPFVDGLMLANMALLTKWSTSWSNVDSNSIIQIELNQPELTFTKWTVSTTNSGSVFTPALIWPVLFSAPGGACPRNTAFSSSQLISSVVQSDIAWVDIGDVLTYALVVENTWWSDAYNILVRNEFPTWISSPSNLCITRGDGVSVSYTAHDGGVWTVESLFGSGILFNDFSPTTWALDAYDATNGSNILLITYDAVVNIWATPGAILENQWVLSQYTSTETWNDFVAEDSIDTVTAEINLPQVSKSIRNTSQSSTSSWTQWREYVVIWEEVEYQVVVEIPEWATLPHVAMADRLDNGLVFVSLDSIYASWTLNSTSWVFASLTWGATISNNDRNLDLDLWDISNSDTNSDTIETLVFEYTVRVDNTSVNNNYNQKNNAVTISNTDFSITANAPNVRVREPRLIVNKTWPSQNIDSERLGTYSITIDHSGSTEDAFDVILIDDLEAQGLAYISWTYSVIGTTPDTITFSGWLTATWDTLAINQQSTIIFDVDLDVAITTDSVLTNTATGTWTSLSGSSVFERTFIWWVNDYIATDAHSINFIFELIPQKDLIATSLPHTIENETTIGEELTYRLRVEVPELAQFSWVIFTDTLDPELEFIAIDSLIASWSLHSSIWSVTWVTMTHIWQQLIWDFDALENIDSTSSNEEFIEIIYRVRVANTPVSQDTEIVNNSLRVEWSEWSNTDSAQWLTITEPAVTISKSWPLTNSNSDREITYQLRIEHLSSSSADAYNMTVTDAVPSQLIILSWAQLSWPTPESILYGQTFSASYDQFATGDIAVFEITAKLDPSIVFNTAINNTVTTQWTNSDGTIIGERTGTWGVNDYTDTDSAWTYFSFAIDIDKQVQSTSIASTLWNNVVVGEIITYEVVLNVPDETWFQQSELSDVLSVWLEFLAVQSIVSSSPSLTYSASSVTTWTQLLEIDLGTLTNTDTNHATQESITIVYTTRVRNIVAVDQWDDITNFAKIQRLGGNQVRQADLVTVIEPSLQLQKTTPATLTNSNRLIPYTFTIDHDGTSTSNAYNITIGDILVGTSMTYIPGSLQHTSGVWIDGSSSVDTWTLIVLIPQLLTGESTTFTVDVQLNADLVAPVSVTNTATATWTSILWDDDAQRTWLWWVDSYTISDTANTIITTSLSPTKNLIDTDLWHTAWTWVVAWEILTYKVVVPIPENSTLHDIKLVDSWDSDLDFTGSVSVVASWLLLLSEGTTTDIVNASSIVWDVLTISLWDITNTDTGGATSEALIITYTLVVWEGVSIDDVLSNNAVFTRSDGSSVVDPVEVIVVEPELFIDKSSSSQMSSSREITYILTIDHTVASQIDAFDIQVIDDLASLGMSVVSVSQTAGPASSIDTSWDIVTLTLNSLLLSQDMVFEVVARLDSGVDTPVTISNTADLNWTSRTGNTTVFTDNSTSATAFATSNGGFVKTIIATNQTHTVWTGVVIGEEITYRVQATIPADATLNDLEITDQLPVWSRLIGSDTITVDTWVTCSFAACVGVSESQVWQVLTWSFGDVTNSLTWSTQTVQIDYTIVIENDWVHSDGDIIVNLATLTWSDDIIGDSAIAVAHISEPQLELTKSVSLDNTATYGRTVRYTIVIDHTNLSSTDAFDIMINDDLSSHNMEYIPWSFVHELWVVPSNTVLMTWLFEVSYDSLTITESSTISFLARLKDTVETPVTISNTATTTRTSLAADNDSDERSGDGWVDNYTDSDTASTQFFTDLTPTKSIINSSLVGSLWTGALIWEVITYVINVEIPNDSIIFWLVIDDQYSAWLIFSWIQSIDAPLGISTTLVGGFDSVTPTVLSTGALFQLGDVKNIWSWTGSESVTVTYDMIVSNDLGSANGTILMNQATVYRNEWEGLKTTSPVLIEVKEPSLVIEKTSFTGWGNIDSSRSVEYHIILSHDAWSEVDAYQVQLVDDLQLLQMSIDLSTLVFSGYQPTTTGLIAWVLTAEYASLPVWESSEVNFIATLDASVATPAMITNTSDMSRTSWPWVWVRGYTGDDTASVTFRSMPWLIQKTIDTTSESWTSWTDVAIWEEVTYAVNVIVPENSTLNDSILTDLIPSWLTYLRLEWIIADTGISVSSPSIGTTATSSWTILTFDFWSLTNTDTNSLDTESVTIRYTVRVDDIPSSIENDSFQNRAVFTWSDESWETPSTTVFAPAIRIVEPTVNITKTWSTTNQESARTVSYTLDVRHLVWSSSDAYDVVVTDVLQTIDLELLTWSLSFSGVVWVIDSYNPLVITYPLLATEESSQIMFDARLDDSIETPDSRVNSWLVNWSSLSWASLYERAYDDTSIISTMFATTTTFSKQLIQWLQAHTSWSSVVVWEVVEYQITFPIEEDSTLNNVIVTDTLPAGMVYLETTVVDVSSAINGNPTPTSIVPVYTTWTNTLIYDFWDLTNTDTDRGTQERIQITYRTVVDNTNMSVSGALLTNTAQLEWSDQTLTWDATVSVLEPQLSLTKQALSSATSGARTITYAIQIGHTAWSMIDAFDLDFIDDLWIRTMEYVSWSLQFTSVTTGSITSNSDPLIVTIDQLLVWETVDFTFQARLNNTTPTNYLAVNTWSLLWSSTPGANLYERSWTGVVAYSTTDSASLQFVTNTSVTMDVVNSSLSTSPISTPVIGELTSYTIAIEVPEDGALTNSVWTLTLPASVSLVGSPVYSVSWAVSSLAVGGINGIGDTYVVWTNTVSFNFNTLTNTDANDSSVEYLYITYAVIVDNETWVWQWTTIQPSFDFQWSDAIIMGVLPITTLTVSEPVIDIVKTDTVGWENVNSARTVTYQVAVTHSGVSNADAYDVTVSDILSLYDLSYVSGTYQSIVGSQWLLETTNGITMTYDHFPLGSTHVFRFDARLSNTIMTDDTNPNNDSTNIVDVAWTSLPWHSWNERTWAGGVNDYSESDSTTIRFTSNWWLDKQFIATSHEHTTWSGVVVGEIITYAITIDIPEDAALNSLIVTDVMDDGLVLTGTPVIIASWDLVTSRSWWFNAIIPVYTSWTNTLFWDLWTVANSNTSTGSKESIVLLYDVLVTNTLQVQNELVLWNTAQSMRSDGTAVAIAPSLIVREPDIVFEISTNDGYPTSSGQVQYQYMVEHTLWSTANAYDVVVTIPVSQYSWSIDIWSIIRGWNIPSSTDITWSGIILVFNVFELWDMSTWSFTVHIDEGLRIGSQTQYILWWTTEWTSLPQDYTTQRAWMWWVDDYTTSDTVSTLLSLIDLELSYAVENPSVSVWEESVFMVMLNNIWVSDATNIIVDLSSFGVVTDVYAVTWVYWWYDETLWQRTIPSLWSWESATLVLTARSTNAWSHSLPISILDADQWDVDSYPWILALEDDEDDKIVTINGFGNQSSVTTSSGGGVNPSPFFVELSEEKHIIPEDIIVWLDEENPDPAINSIPTQEILAFTDTTDQSHSAVDREVLLEELIECAWILNEYEWNNNLGASCYLNDWVFNSKQWKDISTSKHTDSIIFLTQQCYYHGPVDTQSSFLPKTYAKNWELIKIAIRMSQTLSASFSHFDTESENWAVPYYTQARSIGLLDDTTAWIANIYEAVTIHDMFAVYIGLLEYHGILFDTNTILSSIPSSFANRLISREEFAMISHFFHIKLYGESNDEVWWIPDDVKDCLDIIDTKKDMWACMYDDGSFDGDQWSDIQWLPYASAVVEITNACLIHGSDDNEDKYGPMVAVTNAAWVKIAARMWLMVEDDFNHFDITPWYTSYYDVLRAKGILQWVWVDDPQANITLADLVTIYAKILLHAWGDTTTIIESLIPAWFVIDPVNRHALAVVTELFRTQIIKLQ